MALCLVLSLLPMGVLAADPKVTFTVTADRSNAAVGDTNTFTVSIGKVENLHGMLFELDIPEGLTYINGSAQVSNRLKSGFDFGEASFAESTLVFVGVTNSETALTGETLLMSFQCKVDEGPPVPIPNTEVKLICADNTWRATAREDR